ncbi:MAG: DMT family transporter [bacterium]
MTPTLSQGSDTRHSLGLILTVLLVQQLLGALTFPIAKYGLAAIEPFTFAFFRYGISSVFLILIVRCRRYDRPIERGDYPKLIGLGLLIIILNQTAYLFGQSLTAAGHGAVLFATVPLWIFILAVIHLKEKLHWRRIVGLVIALIGVFIVITAGAVKTGTEYLLGDLMILLAVIAWAYYTVLGKPLVQKYGVFRTTAWALVSGSVVYFPFGLYRAIEFDYSGTTTTDWLTVLYVAIGTSVIAYSLWYWLLKRMEASRLAIYHNLQPVVVAGVAYFMLNEPLGWSFVIGGVITVGGVIFSEV